MAKHVKNELGHDGQAVVSETGYVPATSSYEEYKQFERSAWQHKASTSVPSKKKMGLGAKVGVALLALVVLFAVGVGAYIWKLDSTLAVAKDERQEIYSQLATKRNNEPFYILLLGSDKREASDSSERSDVTMLVRVDQKNKQLTLLTIPRDTPVTFEDGTIDRINTAFRDGGVAGAVKVVSEFTGLPISHYMEIRISEFEELIDDLGGIDIEVPAEISVKDVLTGEWVDLEPGMQHINGQQAQALARSRKTYSDGDVSRQNMNRQIVVAVINNVLSRPVEEIPQAALEVASHITTDLGTVDIMSLLASFGTNLDDITIYSATGPAEGGYRTDLEGNWFCYDNPEGWKLIIEAMDAGEDPSQVDAGSYAIIPEE